MYIYINNRIVEEKEATISPFDHGYMYGLGLFETFRVYDGHPFLFDDHLERLKKGLSTLSIQWDMTREDILGTLKQLMIKNDLRNAYVRLNVSTGPGELGLYTGVYDHPTTIMYIKPLPEPSGFPVKEAQILALRRNTPEGEERLKSHHYLNNVLAKREVGDTPHKEGLFLTNDGYVAEGVVSNVFFVNNKKVYTPALDTGILNGITRQFVLSLLKHLDISVVEGFYTERELLESDEVFVTNSIQEIVSITSIGEEQFQVGEGTLTRHLQQLYRQKTSSLWSRFAL
ncbi:aminodeoxychorismate lyase [Priestia koreensis]|uniref:aminodeoxychorismate lyase n=1 Tax=Priestia koreensis TaxID=284581 RepID=UPI0028F728BB|nr:aminodeoxychorismate lyase [Priestia koreensis]